MFSPGRFFFFLFSSSSFCWPSRAACRSFVPRPGIEPVPRIVEAQSPNYWTAREVPSLEGLMQDVASGRLSSMASQPGCSGISVPGPGCPGAAGARPQLVPGPWAQRRPLCPPPQTPGPRGPSDPAEEGGVWPCTTSLLTLFGPQFPICNKRAMSEMSCRQGLRAGKSSPPFSLFPDCEALLTPGSTHCFFCFQVWVSLVSPPN